MDNPAGQGNGAVVTSAEALTYLSTLQPFGYQPGLESTRRLAALVGNPHEALQFIHVAGTNGKGSTCAMLDAIYRASGRRVGLYTSPHLVRFNERIRVQGDSIPDEALARIVERVRDAATGASPPLVPTFFEFVTVVALLWFVESRVDLVVWETGLGGRMDATNIVTPLAAVVTQIGFDHMNVLGPTIGHIASEKAGIFKAGVPALTSATDPDALAILEYKARELGAPFLHVGPSAVEHFRFELALLGEHQRSNGALAAATVRMLRFLLPVSDEQMAAGFASVRWPGRLQVLKRGAQTVLVDGAHNRDGVACLKAALERHFPGRPPALVLGMLADKEWERMVRELVPVASRVIAVPVSSQRTVSSADLRAACMASGVTRPVRAVDSLAEGLRACAADPFVVVTGSLYLVGEALECLGEARPATGQRDLNEWSAPRTGGPGSPAP